MSIDAGGPGSLFSCGHCERGGPVFKLAAWAFIAYLGFRVWRNVSAVWKAVKNAQRPPQDHAPAGRRPVEAPFEVEDGK